MEALGETIVFWTLTAIQLTGLLALATSRIQLRRGDLKLGHFLLLTSLGMVGIAAIFSLTTGSGSWAASVGTLAVMCVGAVLDTGLAPATQEAI